MGEIVAKKNDFVKNINVEGIVLRSTFYAEVDRIITLLTPAGICKLFVKGRRRPDLRLQALTTPFTRGEYLFEVRKSDLYRFVDGTVHEQHLALRDCLEKLNTAQKMVDALLKSQWPNNPSKELYHLFAFFLKKTCETPHLLPFFLIKLLKHEGLLETENRIIQLIAQTRSFKELESVKIDEVLVNEVDALFEQAISK